MTEEGVEEMRTKAREYAKKKGYVLNVNDKQLSVVLRGLARNLERFGAASCPAGSGAGTQRRIRSSSVPASTTRRRSRSRVCATAGCFSRRNLSDTPIFVSVSGEMSRVYEPWCSLFQRIYLPRRRLILPRTRIS